MKQSFGIKPKRMELAYDYPYGQPQAIVFDGERYSKTGKSIQQIIGLLSTTAYVVARVEKPSADFDPMKKGPPMVIFNQAVYRKGRSDPALIEDEAVRTEAFESDPAEEDFDMIVKTPNKHIESNSALQQYTSNGHSYASQIPSEQYVFGTSVWYGDQTSENDHTQRVDSANRPLRSARQMPTKASVTAEYALPYLFDLPEDQRARVTVVEPPHTNKEASQRVPLMLNHKDGREKRHTWTDETNRYLFKLMEIAMLQLNRPLIFSDFRAITEALHRRFQNDPTYPVRGSHPIHSRATRLQAYSKMVNRIFG